MLHISYYIQREDQITLLDFSIEESWSIVFSRFLIASRQKYLDADTNLDPAEETARLEDSKKQIQNRCRYMRAA